MSRRELGAGAIFGAPLLLAVLAVAGLTGALLGDGAWDGIGAGLLATLIVMIVWARLRRRS